MRTFKNVERFKPGRGKESLPGLTTELLADMHDLVHKFGTLEEGGRVRGISLREPIQLRLSAPADPSRTMMIVAVGGNVTVGGTGLVGLPGSEGEVVIWDKRISVKNMEDFIAAIDALAKKKGLIDLVTGERIQTNISAVVEKMKVEEFFKEPLAVMPVFPGGQSAEDILKGFDHPEKLMVIRESGIQTIIRRDSLHDHNRRRDVTLEILKEEGITLSNLDDVTDLSVEKILELRKKVERRLKV